MDLAIKGFCDRDPNVIGLVAGAAVRGRAPRIDTDSRKPRNVLSRKGISPKAEKLD